MKKDDGASEAEMGFCEAPEAIPSTCSNVCSIIDTFPKANQYMRHQTVGVRGDSPSAIINDVHKKSNEALGARLGRDHIASCSCKSN
jgi:hypothetical protein